MFHVKHPSSSLSSFYLDGAFTSSIVYHRIAQSLYLFLFHVEHSLNPKSLKKNLTITNFGFNFFSISTQTTSTFYTINLHYQRCFT